MYDEDLEETNLVKDLRKQRDEMKKELEKLQTQFADQQKQIKARSVEEVLTSKGANPRLAKFALADGVEDEAGAEKWLAENGELFGFQAKPAEPAVDADDLAAMRAVQEATATGGVSTSKAVLESQQLDAAETQEEWIAAVNALKFPSDAQ